MLRLLDRFFGFKDSAAPVFAALGAGVMGQFLLVTVRAFRQTAGCEEVVCAAIGGSARRVAPFRVRHDAIPFGASVGALLGSDHTDPHCPSARHQHLESLRVI